MEINITTRLGRALNSFVYQKIWDEHIDNLNIILIHAFPMNSEMYSEGEILVKKLAEIVEGKYGGVTLVFPDLPGFGESATFGEAPKDLKWYVDSINDISKSMKFEKPIIGGCSMGGYIALAYIEHYPTNGLILIDTRTEADTEEGRQGRIDTAKMIKTAVTTFPEARNIGRLTLKSTTIRKYFSELITKLISKHSKLEMTVRSIIDSQNPEGVRHALVGMAGRYDTSEILQNYDKSVLIIVGEEDILTPVKMAKNMSKLASDSTLAIVKGSGHLVPLEKPDKFREILVEWIKSRI